MSDELNDWYRVKNYREYKQKVSEVNVSYWAKNIFKISFYNGVVAFEKRQNQARNEVAATVS